MIYKKLSKKKEKEKLANQNLEFIVKLKFELNFELDFSEVEIHFVLMFRLNYNLI